MKQSINITGIKTNNLKDIYVSIPYSKIIAITGPSGGGKSSLAYQTIYSLCAQEFSSLEQGHIENPSYKVASYSGLIPSVAIKQTNSNLNPRSTLLSYLNIASYLYYLSGTELLNIPNRYLKINKPGNECPVCYGLGLEQKISIQALVDETKKIKDQPFNCWVNRVTDKETKLLIEHCNTLGIDVEKTFGSLNDKEKDLLLYQESENEYSISFKYNKRQKRKKTKFLGAFLDLDLKLKSKNISDRKYAEKYCSSFTCSCCFGSRINIKKYKDFSVFGISYDVFLTAELKDITRTIKKFESRFRNNPAYRKILSLLSTVVDIGLGYLSLSRSIPSLSGGELQKLNFSLLANSEISNVLFVIDEISSQLHASDYSKIFNNLERIKSLGNTVIIVEHSKYFIDRTDFEISIGPGSGDEGGYLYEPELNDEKIEFLPPCENGLFQLPEVTINNIHKLVVSVPFKSITAICGKSGSGKSSYAKGLNEVLENVVLVSQQPIRGNERSTIATFSEINMMIASWYSVINNIDVEYFLPSAGKKGSCVLCEGKGTIRYERSYDVSINIECPECDGKLFSNLQNDFKVSGFSVSELYDMSVDLILGAFDSIPDSISKRILLMSNLGLGHLSLNRRTTSLSGGEMKRLKLVKYLSKRAKDKILIIDEPGSGLDDKTINSVMAYLNMKKSDYKAILIIDHKESVFSKCDYLIEFGPGSGKEGGEVVYLGHPENYYNKHLNYLYENQL